MCKALNVEIFETLRAIKEDLRSWRYTLWSCVGDSAVLGWQFPPNCPIDVTPPFTEGNRGWNRQSEMFTFRCLIGGILVRLFHVCFLSQKEGPQVAFLEASWAQFCVFRQPACRTGLLLCGTAWSQAWGHIQLCFYSPEILSPYPQNEESADTKMSCLLRGSKRSKNTWSQRMAWRWHSEHTAHVGRLSWGPPGGRGRQLTCNPTPRAHPGWTEERTAALPQSIPFTSACGHEGVGCSCRKGQSAKREERPVTQRWRSKKAVPRGDENQRVRPVVSRLCRLVPSYVMEHRLQISVT